MKNFSITLMFLAVTLICQSQTPCINGTAGSYPCKDYDLMSRITLNQMSAGAGNDSWGWTDPQTSKEYAIIGLNNGTAFIDISNPTNPVYLGKLPTATTNSSWRDVKVYQNHAFIVSEASNHGMQVFDLTRLRSVSNPGNNFTADARYTEFGNAHNIVINEDSGYAYVVGAQRNSGTYAGGPLFINIQNPKNPTNAGGFLSGGQRAYTHDAQVVTYNGPDSNYTGREILIGSNEIEVVIADITNKSNPVTIATIKYPDVGYTHQGWFTEDMRYFILGDETDEQRVGFNTRTVVFDFQDLDNPQQHMIYTGPTAAIDHNGYVKGNTFYLASYRAGIRMIDISNIGSKNMSEVGFFDTYPQNDGAAFNGVWNVYPYFNSGNIVISDIEGGFFLVRKSNPAVCQATVPTGVSSSNIGSDQATVSWNAVSGTSYDIRHRAVGSTAWTNNSLLITSSIISGLTSATQYEAQVRSRCPDGSTSNYSSSITFTTTGGGPGPGPGCSATVSSFPFSESFETNLGQWSDATSGDDLNFTRNSNGTPSVDTGPDAAADGTTYIYVEASGNGTGFPNKRAILNSPCLDFTSLTVPNLTFQYHMLGSEIESLTVEARTDNTGDWTPVFSRIGAQGANWNAADVDLSAYAGEASVQLRFNVLTGDGTQGWQSDIAIDAVSIQEDPGNPDPDPDPDPSGCSGGITSFPFSESFETSLGQWSDDAGDDLNFTRNSGGTPSNNTGPSSAADGTSYIFVEASGNGTGFPDKRAILNSPCLDFSNLTGANLTFQYHMFGSTINSLTVEASINNGVDWDGIFSRNGAQGNAWNFANVDLSAYAGQAGLRLRFIVVTGLGTTGWQSDIAIDDVSIQEIGGGPGDPACDALNFNNFTITGFSNQDSAGDFSIVSGGAGLSLSNNTWKYIGLNYTVTASTVIEFDFSSTSQGEIHGVGFEDDNTLTATRYFKIHGTQNYGVTNFDNYVSGTTRYTIPVGSFYTGSMDRLVFINDNDAGSGNNSIFSNVRIYEGTCGATLVRQVADSEKIIPIYGDTYEDGFPMRLFPNPISGSFLNVSMITKDVFNFEIKSITGQLVGKGTVSNNKIDVSNLKAGIYFLQVVIDNQVASKRFIRL